jgi:hypothetical protein
VVMQRSRHQYELMLAKWTQEQSPTTTGCMTGNELGLIHNIIPASAQCEI